LENSCCGTGITPCLTGEHANSSSLPDIFPTTAKINIGNYYGEKTPMNYWKGNCDKYLRQFLQIHLNLSFH